MNIQYNENREDELLDKLDEIGFTEISPDAFIKQFPEFQDKIRRPIQKVWGLKMRADAWADTWVMKVDDKYSPYVTFIDGKQRMWSGAFFVLSFLKKISESLKEQLAEKLSKKQPASEWIHDFVYSKNPKFAGKTKKERIQMALGAYYAAQKNEDVDASSLFKPYDDSIEYDPEQLGAGIKIEMEHTDDEEIATIIAKHHLAEDPEYYIKLASCVEKDLQEAKIVSYSYDKVISKLKDGSWDSSYDVKKGKHLEVFDNMTKKNIIIFVEEYGAGFEGTNALRDKYIKDTPGQSIQHFKTNMKEKVYSTYQEFAAQHKKMYPSHTEDQIKAAYKKYSEYSEMDEAYGESWVVYNKDTKSKISKSFKNRKAAYLYAAKNGGVVYSAEYYFDHRDEINSGKLVKEASSNPITQLVKEFDMELIPQSKWAKNYQTNVRKVKQLYGIPQGNGEYDDVYFVVYDDENKPYGVVDIEGTSQYAKFSDAKAGLKFALNSMSETLQEAQNLVSKGIYTLDGKKIEGARSSKLFLQALDSDGFLHNLSWKEWSESNLKDTSSDNAKKQFVDRLAKQIKMFNKRIDLNTWLKGGDRSFTDTVNYIFKLDPNIKYAKTSGLKEESLQEAINIRDYMATSEKSSIGGYRPKVVGKDGKTMYLGDKSYKTPEGAKDHAEEYLKQYARGIPSRNIKVDIKESSQEKSSNDYSTWIIKPREGGEPVKIKAPDESSAIEIALGRKPSQHELDFFNFHYICICEKVELSTARNMKIVELATKCRDEKILKEYVEQQYKPGSSVLTIKESFKKFTSNK